MAGALFGAEMGSVIGVSKLFRPAGGQRCGTLACRSGGGAGRLAGLSEQAGDINAAPPEGLIDRSSYFRGCELRVRRCKLCE